MPESDKFITLKTQLDRLKDEFLPEISPTGSYSESQLSRTAAYRVLAHAEIESYLEERAWKIVIDAKKAWETGKTTRTLICLLGFSDLTMDKPPDTLKKPNNVKQDNHDKRLEITEKINSAIKSFKKVIDNNHGLKEKNILALLLRYIGFHYFLSDYRGNLKEFLDMTCEKLNNQRYHDITNIVNQFEEAVKTTINIFEEKNFSRLWSSRNNKYQSQFNRAILDVMVFYFSDEIIRKSAEYHQEKVKIAFQELCSSNSDFREAVERRTQNIP
ncbi:MAG: hypothetical protein ACLBM4_10985, partial [Dolichospermum sp.]